MFKLVKRHLKNEKGLTLIELLAVVVILGIIAAIAIPAIGGLIDNTKKDAHIANATQMINSAKTYAASNNDIAPSPGTTLKLADMIAQGLIDGMDDPDSGDYDTDASFVTIVKTSSTAAEAARYTYTVTLVGSERKIDDKKQPELTRSVVEPLPVASGG